MDFNKSKPIFRQIVDLCYHRILAGDWQPEARVPSVRELGTELAVNSHTVLKAYEVMEKQKVITQKRGLGFFLTSDAPEKVMAEKRKEFYDETLPAIFAEMKSLGIGIDDVVTKFSVIECSK